MPSVAVRAGPVDRIARPTDVRGVSRSSAAYLSCLLMVFASVSWRPDNLYSGGLDAVVLTKALLTVIAFTVAWNAHQRRNSPQPIRTLPVWFLLAYLVTATFGAYSTDVWIPSFVLVLRVVILALTVLALARTYPVQELMRAWFNALITVGLLSAITGLPTLVADGRLGGGIPQLNPNEVATVCGLGAIGMGWLVFLGRARARHVVLLLVLLGAVWASGSRTSLLAVLLAVVVMFSQARRLSRTLAVGVVASSCGIVYLIMATDVVSNFLARGGQQSLTTFASRTIAWSAAFDYSDSEWVRMMGSGLAKKEIPVSGQYWQTQVLDSSWASALVQAGRIGAILLALWVLWAVVLSFTGLRDRRMIFTALMAYLLVRSVLESGLVDSTTSFLTFLLVSVLAGADPRPLLDRSGRAAAPAVQRGAQTADP